MGFKKALEWTKLGRIWVRGPGINLEVGHQAWRFLCLESRGHLRGGRARPRPWRGCWCWWPWPSVIRKKCLAPGNCWQPLKNEFIILNGKIIKEIFMRNSCPKIGNVWKLGLKRNGRESFWRIGILATGYGNVRLFVQVWFFLFYIYTLT